MITLADGKVLQAVVAEGARVVARCVNGQLLSAIFQHGAAIILSSDLS